MPDHSELDQDITRLQMGAHACRHAVITFETLKLLSTWNRGYSSNAVFEIDGRLFLKIFGPAVPEQFQIERAMLEAVWKEMPRKEQLAIAGELGEIVAAINAWPKQSLGRVERR